MSRNLAANRFPLRRIALKVMDFAALNPSYDLAIGRIAQARERRAAQERGRPEERAKMVSRGGGISKL